MPRVKFAFLVHPRNDVRADMVRALGPLAGLVPSRGYEAAFERLPVRPVVMGTIRASDEPDADLGWVVGVLLSPRQLLCAPRPFVRARIGQAVDRARALGADVVGLGALTAPATAGGVALAARTDVGITNGNAYTAVVTAQAVRSLLTGLATRDAARPLVALVGATGSVGSAVARLLARDDEADLLLVGRSTARLTALARELGPGARASTDLAAVRRARVVVLLTSATDALLGPEHLGEGAVVLDDTQPRATSPALLAQRPDVTVLDGGLVATPGLRRSGGSIGLPPDRSFACLAETALLALAGHRGHGTIGQPSLAQADRLEELARRSAGLGFGLAPPTSFGAPAAVAG